MQTMSAEERRQFLTTGTRTGKLSTVRGDGRPHVVPVWFLLDGDDILFTTGLSSVKGKNLTRDPRVSLCVDEEVPPYAYVMIDGTASLSEDPDQTLDWATRIAARYMGADRAEDYGRRIAAPGEALVRVTPTKIVALKEIVGPLQDY